MSERDAGEGAVAREPADAPSWRRLHPRIIWVDLAQSVLALLPAAVGAWVVGPGSGQLWPLVVLAVVGVGGAIRDALRWTFTRYRVTSSHVELKTGVLLRTHRSIQRDRIRSVDVEARLRHRLVGLRVVKIGAGQQAAAGESALALDAVLAADGHALRHLLLRRSAPGAGSGGEGPEAVADPGDDGAPIAVLARFRPGWVVYNVFNVWAYVLALGVGWGAFWLLGGFGVDVGGFVAGVVDWGALGWGWGIALAVIVVGGLGALGLGLNYFAEYWDFELARVPGEHGTLLRTRRGFFTTREVNRDDNRMRGVQISEPVAWRWLGVTDTTVVTTGLSMWSMSQPAAIVPRGPVREARRIAGAALGAEPNPLEAPLARHPRAALRRRLWWATFAAAAVTLALASWVTIGVTQASTLWAVVPLWPCAALAAIVAHRALGHAIVGPYVVARSGLISRSTTVLRTSAVSTIVLRESLLQRRLGLRSVGLMTAAGHGAYFIPDVDASHGVHVAARAAPGLLEPFLSSEQRSPR